MHTHTHMFYEETNLGLLITRQPLRLVKRVNNCIICTGWKCASQMGVCVVVRLGIRLWVRCLVSSPLRNTELIQAFYSILCWCDLICMPHWNSNDCACNLCTCLGICISGKYSFVRVFNPTLKYIYISMVDRIPLFIFFVARWKSILFRIG